MNFDLHCHSTYSDGTLSPANVVERAARRGVEALALTDHDDTGGLATAREVAAARGIQFIDGVEISVTWRGNTIHILGLGIAPDNVSLQAGLAATRGGRTARAARMAAAFDALGITGSLEGARRFADNPQMIGRPHFARFLLQEGVVKDLQAAFRRFLGAGQPCYVAHVWASLVDAVGWIVGSGGIAVIAHPGRYPLDTSQLAALLGEFRDAGGTAIEVVCGGHKPHQYAVFARHARCFGLAASAGSDFHAPGETFFDLGGLPALPKDCASVLEALYIRH